MSTSNILFSPDRFSELLYEKMQQVNAGVGELAPYEFRYGLDNLCLGEGGWAAVALDGRAAVEAQVNRREFYAGIQLKPRVAGQIVLDEAIAGLTRMLFVGLVTGEYPPEWVSVHFSFDLRGFYFPAPHRYLTQEAAAHLGGVPFKVFEPQQRRFDRCDAIGYKDFEAANAEIDGAFIGASSGSSPPGARRSCSPSWGRPPPAKPRSWHACATS